MPVARILGFTIHERFFDCNSYCGYRELLGISYSENIINVLLISCDDCF